VAALKLFVGADRSEGVRVAFAIPAMLSALLIGLLASTAAAQTPQRLELHGERAATAPKLDGVLDEAVWAREPIPLEGWASYNPLLGEPARQRTSVWIAYDTDALYFAFRCFDEEPSKIRTTITRRDNAWNDDWIGVSLDSTRA